MDRVTNGQHARIVRGPLADCVGVVHEYDEQSAAVTLGQYQVAIVPRADLAPIDDPLDDVGAHPPAAARDDSQARTY